MQINMHNHTAKKRFGQNFLNNGFIIDQIINIIKPNHNDFVVEIGPGLAALTKPLLSILSTLHVIEIDRDIIAFLQNNFEDNLVIHNGDALKFDYNSLSCDEKIRVIGNLPYNISTPLLFHLTQYENIKDMHFMLQNEVVERICATPNCHAYGRLSIMIQYRFNCTKMLDVSRDNFTPAPKVESAIIRITPKPKTEWQHIDHNKLNYVVTHAFNQRRKTISNSLKKIINSDTLKELGINPQSRAENLTITDYIKLSQYCIIQ